MAMTYLGSVRAVQNYNVMGVAKAALESCIRYLALDLGEMGGVRVNAIAPGIISTAMSDKNFDAEAIARLVPMKRPGTPQEVASLVAYLVSDEAGYLTAQIISISGGMASITATASSSRWRNSL